MVLEKTFEVPIRWFMEKATEFQKNIYFCFIDYAKAFDCVDHSKLWKILKEMGIPDHLTYLMRVHWSLWVDLGESHNWGVRPRTYLTEDVSVCTIMRRHMYLFA